MSTAETEITGVGALPHRLDPLLKPRSMALVGASARVGSVGHSMVTCCLRGGFAGEVFLVNPRYDEIEGAACAGSLSDLGCVPDMVVAGVGGVHMEALFEEAVSLGVPAITVFDACHGKARDGGSLVERLRDMARDAGIAVCGGNGMGFLNIAERCHASFYNAGQLKPGGITLIAHSGSVFTVLALNDPRYRFNLVISAGQELGAYVDEYIDFALTQPETRVIAIFMEAARRPEAFSQALARAQDANVPVVACKVGRTEESARFARSHSGALTGDDAAYDALFEHYGVIRADTVDELMNTALLLEQGRTVGQGGLGIVTDSGGLRELVVDRAKYRGVALARLSEDTRNTLRKALPEELVADNPVDAAGSLSKEFSAPFADALSILGGAPEVAAIGYEIDARDDYIYLDRLFRLAEQLPETTDKPCFVFSSFSCANNRALADRLADLGVPLINGQDEMLSAVRNLFKLRAYTEAEGEKGPVATAPEAIVEPWRARLGSGQALSEAEGLALLGDFGIAAAKSAGAETEAETLEAARRLGFPVVLKTASGLAHKSDAGGVRLNIPDEAQLKETYRELSAALGPSVLVQTMVPAGVEIAFGCVADPDFGPLVMVSAGGTLIEYIGDHVHALAPFGVATARRLIDRLGVRPLLDGARGAEAADVEALAQALSRFSIMCAAMGSGLAEADVNPVVAGPRGCIAVDTLIVPA